MGIEFTSRMELVTEIESIYILKYNTRIACYNNNQCDLLLICTTLLFAVLNIFLCTSRYKLTRYISMEYLPFCVALS